jgi:hypothetical protein
MPVPPIVICFALVIATLVTAEAAPRISEFLAVNDSILADGDGDFSDWIEIHNPDATALDLTGYYLTDDAQNLTRWQFPPSTTIPAGEYLIVFASGKAAALHANFKLSSSGEYLGLIAPDGQTVIDEYTPTYPVQYADISYGDLYYTQPTPGSANIGGIIDPAAVVGLAPGSQTFTGSIQVSMSTQHPTGQIRYTTDGTDPTPTSSLYSAPISRSATTQIRAGIFVNGEAQGFINSASYIRLSASVENFNSPLPIVIIENFGGGVIPDKRAANPPAGDGGGITQVARQGAFMAIIDRDAGGTARLSDAPVISSRIGIRVRGSSSASQPAKKENYSIETWGAVDDDEVNIQPFGMPSDDDWILYAPYNYDRALVRNTFVYELMRRMGHYSVRTQLVEVFVNTEGDDLSTSDFAGVFVFNEKVKKSKQRVNISDLSANGSTGGWLIESNRKDPLPEDGSGTPPYNFHTAGPNGFKQGPYGGSSGADQGGDDIPTGYNTFLNFVEPGGYDSTQAQRDAISGWFDTFEGALYSDDYRRPDIGYRAHLDVESFIDHYLMVNLTRSVDGLQLSTFMYLPDTYGKLHLNPVWDYDRSMDSYDGRDNSTSGMWGQNFLWFPRLFSDTEFNQNYVDRWQKLRRGILSTANMHALIDSMAAEITAPVAAANFSKWNASNNTPRSGGWPAEIMHMKTWLSNRAAWIDGQFLPAPQFSKNGNLVTLSAASSGTIYYTTDGSDPRLPDLPGADIELVSEFAPGRGLIPGASIGDSWKGGSEPFDDSAWISGNTGIGFDYPAQVGIDVTGMRGNTGSVYLRVPFTAPAGPIASLTLNMKYEDGFVAWINGVEVASHNKPALLQWDSTTGGVSRSNVDAIIFAPFDISAHAGVIQPGTNILAIQVMNSSINNGDVLALPQLITSTGSSGGVSPQAQSYSSPLNLTAATKIVARLENNGQWSGPIDATYMINTVPASDGNLVVSEIMYRPADASPAEILAGFSDRDEFEYIELMNISATDTVDLTGVQFVESNGQGILFDFNTADIQFLAPGELLILVENPDAFAMRYGSYHPVAGRYSGALSNDGETLTLLDSSMNIIRAFTYNDQTPWPTAADGDGYSLVLVAPSSNPDHSLAANWCPSANLNGTPGNDDGIPFTPGGDLISYALAGTDQVEFADGQFSYTVDLTAKDAQTSVEISTDLQTWTSSDLQLLSRTHNGDGTETLSWIPTAIGERVFLRLKVTL